MSAYSKTTRQPSEKAPGSAPEPTAALVSQNGDKEVTYAMFGVRNISPEGAFLEGALFLEIDEEMDVDLMLDGGDPMRVHARVVGLDHGEIPGMDVVFSGLSDQDRKRIEKQAAGAAKT